MCTHLLFASVLRLIVLPSCAEDVEAIQPTCHLIFTQVNHRRCVLLNALSPDGNNVNRQHHLKEMDSARGMAARFERPDERYQMPSRCREGNLTRAGCDVWCGTGVRKEKKRRRTGGGGPHFNLSTD